MVKLYFVCTTGKLSQAFYELGTIDHVLAILAVNEQEQSTLHMGLRSLSVLLDAGWLTACGNLILAFRA